MSYLELMKKAKATTTDTTKAPDAVQPPGPLNSPGPTEPMNIRSARAQSLQEEDKHRRLLAAGWSPKERSGKIIWKRPDNGFYVSEEIAVHFLDTGIVNAGTKAGQTERGNTTG